ncbi:MAG: hypothetical protein E6271_03120 [Negativicoccus succinicivorans]|nr:hypothetical protein [Negativicoccus succinicivorans]
MMNKKIGNSIGSCLRPRRNDSIRGPESVLGCNSERLAASAT